MSTAGITPDARLWASRDCSESGNMGSCCIRRKKVDCALTSFKPESEQYESLGWVLLQALNLRLSFEPRDRNGISLE